VFSKVLRYKINSQKDNAYHLSMIAIILSNQLKKRKFSAYIIPEIAILNGKIIEMQSSLNIYQ